MEKHDFRGYVEWALRVRGKQFNLRSLLHGNPERDIWFSHFLCEADRISPLGLGGSAFRCWVAGLFRNGVYVCSNTYRIGVWFASDPAAKPIPGCQDSCAYGNPWPRLSDDATWVSVMLNVVPDELRRRVLAEATAIARIGAEAVIRRGWELKEEIEAKRAKRKQEQSSMLAAWGVMGDVT